MPATPTAATSTLSSRVRSASLQPSTSNLSDLFAASRQHALIATRVPKFLRCLYDILHDEDPTILSWSADGKYFQIYDTKRLEAHVLPKYFKHSKFASFQRQLNNFGFRKWTKTQANVCTFSHHHFVRREPHQLVDLIVQQNTEAAHNGDNRLNCNTNKRRRGHAGDQDHPPAQQLSPKLRKREQPGTLKRRVSPIDFTVESWDMQPATTITTSWQKVTTDATKLRNDTPTSACGHAEVPFNFTVDELNDLMFTTGAIASEYEKDQEMQYDIHMLNECLGIQSGVGPAHMPMPQQCLSYSWEQSDANRTEFDLYVQDQGLWMAN